MADTRLTLVAGVSALVVLAPGCLLQDEPPAAECVVAEPEGSAAERATPDDWNRSVYIHASESFQVPTVLRVWFDEELVAEVELERVPEGDYARLDNTSVNFTWSNPLVTVRAEETATGVCREEVLRLPGWPDREAHVLIYVGTDGITMQVGTSEPGPYA